MRYWTLYLSTFILVHSGAGQAQDTAKNGRLIGIFDGRTPCQELAAQLEQPTVPECWKIKWRLKLYATDQGGTNGQYALEGFVFRKENILRGEWRLIKGTNADPLAQVIELTRKKGPPIYLQKADENILFILDLKKNIMVGNRNFSYTLNRNTEKESG